MNAAGCCVTNASLVTVGEGKGMGVALALNVIGASAVGVMDDTTTGVETLPPAGVGVRYCPHRDALPTHDAVNRDTAILKAEIRFTFRPLRELYLY